MLSEKQIKDILKSNKKEIPDNGFSKKVNAMLPERRSSMIPQLIIMASLLLGALVVICLQDTGIFYEYANDIAVSTTNMQMPSFITLMHFAVCILSTAVTGLAIYRSDII